MHVFNYRASRTVNLDGVFSVTGNDTELGGLFLRLKNIMTSELHILWDLAFLEQYISEHMVPRSLRWEVHPQQGDPVFDSWFKYFNEAGIHFLGFLISKKRNRLIVLDKEIKELKDKFVTHKDSLEYNSLSSNLQSHLEKEDGDRRIQKHKKYSRDVGDYKTNAVFGWQKTLMSASPMDTTPTVVTGLPSLPVPSMVPSGLAAQFRARPSPLAGTDAIKDASSSQLRPSHRSPHTPNNHSRGRGNNWGTRGGRGQSRGNSHHAPTTVEVAMSIMSLLFHTGSIMTPTILILNITTHPHTHLLIDFPP